METPAKVIGSILLVLVIGTSYYYLAPDSWKFWGGQTANTIDSIVDNEPEHERITAKHQYKNGTHIIAGEVNLPTPCYVLSTSAHLTPGQSTIDFIAKTSDEVCAEVVTTERFRVDFDADEDVTIKATWNGKPVELNLIPVSGNEDLADFEIYVK